MIKITSYTKFGANLNMETGSGYSHIDFRLFSKNGTAAILCLFHKASGEESFLNIKMEKEGEVFKTSLELSSPEFEGILKGEPLYYGYRVFGPNYKYTENWTPGSKKGFISKLDKSNNRFNPNKLAYDPYTKELSHLHSDVSDNNLEMFRSNEFYFEDNQKIAPKSVFKINNDIEIQKTSKRALVDEIIGEVHLKSLTALSGKDNAGTYKGAGEFASKIKSLGITMVEFLPVYEFDDKEGIGNYWGYMPLCYFAPHKKYSFNQNDGEVITEFREMINALHKEDIKVCLDVVYNHTGEARIYNKNKEDVNLFSYALIDNREYYKSNDDGFYVEYSGCCNDSNTAGEGFKNLITDSLEYWINQGVDAFRFDLATSLMDTKTDASVYYDKNKSIVGHLKNELEKRGIKINNPDEAEDGVNLIAEPWTCSGYNAYQLGNFPEFFAEWNDISRNTIRAFSCRPRAIDFLAIRHVLCGSSHKFDNPKRSVNFVSCHDGFTLWDLNSYDKKSASTCGGSDWEICSSYNGDKTLRDKAIRNEAALLTLSYGCFMIQADDIVLHSKDGNNNSYNLDNQVNYIDFENLPEEKRGLSDFIKNLIEFRKKQSIFKDELYIKNMEFYGHLARVLPDILPFWTLPDMNFMSFTTSDGKDKILAAMNKGNNKVKFILPESKSEKNLKYYLVFDTKNNDFYKDGILYETEEKEKTYTMEPHTIVLMFIKEEQWNLLTYLKSLFKSLLRH